MENKDGKSKFEVVGQAFAIKLQMTEINHFVNGLANLASFFVIKDRGKADPTRFVLVN